MCSCFAVVLFVASTVHQTRILSSYRWLSFTLGMFFTFDYLMKNMASDFGAWYT